MFRRIINIFEKLFSSKTLTDDNLPTELQNDSPEIPLDISVDFPWWVEIYTMNPRCLYYFGPFDSMEEAKEYQPGYIEDLESEGAADISFSIKRCQPKELTQEWDD